MKQNNNKQFNFRKYKKLQELLELQEFRRYLDYT